MTDQELMKAVVAGDSGAADELVSRYGRKIFAYLLGWLKDVEEAHEITQEVLFRVCRKARTYNGGASLSAWIFTVARNLLIDRTRSRNFKLVSATLPLEDGPVGATASPHSDSPEHRAMRQEITTRVREAIDTLPPRQREVVQLRLLGELSLEEIAQAVGLSLGGVKSTLHNALRNLRGRLADLQGDHYVHL
jgi:RNA polymerase sigma factor (sigma-70 family)